MEKNKPVIGGPSSGPKLRGEQLVDAYIVGKVPIPDDLKVLVAKYRDYAKARVDCVSYPKVEDDKYNKLYDALVVLAE